jgi:chitin disaccharide deacetylase
MGEKFLIVNADDYGHSPGTSQGILEAHLKGVVTSTSVMITFPGAAEEVKEAQKSTPNLGLGLHFAISGQDSRPALPTSEVSSLLREGGLFHPINTWYSHYTNFNPDELRREMLAQYDLFVKVAGQKPDHLDSHHHLTFCHPAALRTMFEIAKEHKIPVRNPGFVNGVVTDEAIAAMLGNVPESVRVSIIEETKQIYAAGHPRWPDTFHVNFYDTTATLGDLLLTLTNLPEGVNELMSHPGYADEKLISIYAAKREDEITILTHKSVQEVIKSQGITLTNYAVLNEG